MATDLPLWLGPSLDRNAYDRLFNEAGTVSHPKEFPTAIIALDAIRGDRVWRVEPRRPAKISYDLFRVLGRSGPPDGLMLLIDERDPLHQKVTTAYTGIGVWCYVYRSETVVAIDMLDITVRQTELVSDVVDRLQRAFENQPPSDVVAAGEEAEPPIGETSPKQESSLPGNQDIPSFVECDKLQPRLRKVATCLAQGMDDAAIAKKYKWAKSTVVGYRKDIQEIWNLEHQTIELMQQAAREKGC